MNLRAGTDIFLRMPGTHQQILEQIDAQGYAILPHILDANAVQSLLSVISKADDEGDSRRQKRGQIYALRNLLARVPEVAELAFSPAMRALVDPILGPHARVVRALLFDKTAGANWKVAWHQDLSIAVSERIDVEGFGPWSMKAAVQHVQPPIAVLERMLTLRLHLDDCFEDNGPLLVLAGSHAAGVLSPAQVADWRARVAPVACAVGAGGVVLMRPLLLHASSAATAPRHRRVVHLEFASGELPGSLKWAVEQ
jgi:ectoine hydroxylase-related dioxygenase (phytanoyl-CoA dioxygenase family)